MKRLMTGNLKWVFLLLLVTVIALPVSASGKQDDSASVKMAEDVNTDPLGKYEEPITVSTFFEIEPPLAEFFTKDRIMNNIWQKQYLAELGINLEYVWFAAQSEEDSVQKKNIAIASGDIPDIMMVNKEQLALLAKSDLINKNIGDVYDMYASDHLKEWMTQEGSAAMDSATFGGKVIAIPSTDSSIDTAPFLWIRADWLDNLGMSVPKTMDELYKVMKAFKENDPDKDGKNDTLGLILHREFVPMRMAADAGDGLGLFNGFGSYPRAWVEDGKGGLVYGSIQPETRNALVFLNKLYEEGLIEEDFGVKDMMKVSELSASGRAGIQYGAMWNAMWPLMSTLENDPNANWIPVAIPTATSAPAKPQIKLNIPWYYVVSKDAEHPEALIKLLNFFVEKFSYASPEEYKLYLVDDTGIPQFALHETMFKTYNALNNLQAYWHVNEAFEKDDPSILNAEELNYYNSIVGYNNGDMSFAGAVKTFGKDGAFKAMNYYYEGDLFQMDAFYGATTDTMKRKMQLIKDKEMEYFTKVIMGVENISTFGSFVEELNKIGLEQITAEVNQWYSAK